MKYILLSFVGLILISCQSNIFFSEATPPGVNPITSIPDQFHGVYMCESDSSYIFADKFLVYKESYHGFTASIDEIEDTEDCSLQTGGLYLPGRQDCVPFEYLDEYTITAKVYDVDTLFEFNEHQIAKFYKGRLFLNYINKRDDWTTFMISPEEDGSLLWELIDVPERSLDSISTISADFKTRIIDDKVKYVLRPTLVEFETILNRKYTVECDRLQPVNMEH